MMKNVIQTREDGPQGAGHVVHRFWRVVEVEDDDVASETSLPASDWVRGVPPALVPVAPEVPPVVAARGRKKSRRKS